MKLMSKFEFKTWLSYLLLVICGIMAYAAINNLALISAWFSRILGYLSPFIAGFVIAYLLDIPCSCVEKLVLSTNYKVVVKHARGIGVLITYAGATAVIVIVMRLLIPEIVSSIMEFWSNIPFYFQRTADFITEITQDESLTKALGYEAFVEELSLKRIIEAIGYNPIWKSIIGILSVSTYLVNITIAIVSSMYLLLEIKTIGGFFNKVVSVLIPPKNSMFLIKYLSKTNQYFKKFLYCTLIDGVIIGTVSVGGMLLLGTQYAIVLGVIEGLTNMVPYFGAIVGTIIVVIITLLTDGVGKAAAVGLFLFVLQQIDGNVIKVKLYGDSFQISPFLVLLSITFGGACYGVLGMVIAIPAVAVLKSILDDALDYKAKKNAEKGW